MGSLSKWYTGKSASSRDPNTSSGVFSTVRAKMITLCVGIFFIVLAIVFAFAAGGEYVRAQRQWTPAGKTRRRVAFIFALVGSSLCAWQILIRR